MKEYRQMPAAVESVENKRASQLVDWERPVEDNSPRWPPVERGQPIRGVSDELARGCKRWHPLAPGRRYGKKKSSLWIYNLSIYLSTTTNLKIKWEIYFYKQVCFVRPYLWLYFRLYYHYGYTTLSYFCVDSGVSLLWQFCDWKILFKKRSTSDSSERYLFRFCLWVYNLSMLLHYLGRSGHLIFPLFFGI